MRSNPPIAVSSSAETEPEHHGGARCHDQHAAGVLQHRGERVEVALRADVHAVHDDVNDTTRLGEGDDAPHDARRGVEILGAAVHRDARATRDRDPLHRQPQTLGQIQDRDDPIALGDRQRPHAHGRVREDQHAPHALGHLLGGRVDDAEDDGAGVLAVGAAGNTDRGGPLCRGIEVVLLEAAGRDPVLVQLHRARSAGEHADDLVGVDQVPAARLDHLALVVLGRLEGVVMGLSPGELHATAGGIRDDDLDRPRRCVGRLAVQHVEPHHHLLESEVTCGRREPTGESLHELRLDVDGRRREQHDAVPLHAPARIAHAQVVAQTAAGLEVVALERGHVEAGLVPLDIVGRAPAHVGEHEDALVPGDLGAAHVKAVDVLGRIQPLDLEVAQAVEIDARRGLGMNPVQPRHRLHAAISRDEGLVLGRRSGREHR